MPQMPDTEQTYELECPHCHKSFSAQPVSGRAARYAGFKCPHCRLFVPFARVTDDGDGDAAKQG